MSELAPSEHKFRSVLTIVVTLWDRAPWLLNAAGGVAAFIAALIPAIVSLWPVNWKTFAFLGLVGLTVILLVVAPLMASRRQRMAVSMEREIMRFKAARDRDSDNLQAKIRHEALNLLDAADLKSQSARISVYQHHDLQEKFVLVGRASSNPHLAKSGRPYYDDSYGVIASAWRKGSMYDNTNRTGEKWIERQCSRFGMPRGVVDGISMQSRSLLGLRLDYFEDNVGVLIVESQSMDEVTSAHEESLRTHDAFGRLILMLVAAPRLPIEVDADL